MSRPIGHAPPRSPDASRPSIVGETGVYGSQWVMRCRHSTCGLLKLCQSKSVQPREDRPTRKKGQSRLLALAIRR